MTPIGTESKTVTKLSQKCTNDECKIRVSERARDGWIPKHQVGNKIQYKKNI